jgi:hypothetical protein
MNTQIYLWVEPMVMNHKRCTDKVYFNCIVEGNHTSVELVELEDLIGGKKMDEIMAFADIDSNWNYGVVSSKATNKKPLIEYAISPEKTAKDKSDKVAAIAKKKEDGRIAKILSSKKPLQMAKNNLEIQDGGMIDVKLPSVNFSGKIDFPKIWLSLEKQFIGKIKEGDTVKLTDDDGNIIFEIQGGSFLNVALADLTVNDSTKEYFPLKGGLYIRDDGSIDVGDFHRTFYLKIYTNNLLKASLKVKKSLMDLTQKLLK